VVSAGSTGRSVAALVAWLALCYVAAAVGALATLDAPAFYGALARPTWAPPPWLFGPVWTALYTAMGVAAWLVWRTPANAGRAFALRLFVTQLVLNALWSWLFFTWRLGAWSFVEIAVLWLLIAATLVAFYRRSAPAGVLLVPYLGWVSFAAALNWTLWTMNPGILGGSS
jgi:tryptophan-rich sensory protein